MILEHCLQFSVLIFLLGLSAFFSGSETALFSLSQHKLNEIKNSGTKSQKIASELLKTPSELLVGILLGNLVVNVLFFCISASLAVKIGQNNPFIEVVFGIVILVSVIIFGEVLPKAVGINHSLKLAALTAVPLKVWMKSTLPFAKVVIMFMNLIEKKRDKKSQNITTDELKMLLNYSADGGEISDFTSEMIEDVMELSCLKVKHVMTPRVDLVFCSKDSTINEVTEIGLKNRVYFLPVYDKNEDDVVGLVSIRRLCFTESYKTDLSKYIIPVRFIPENKLCGQLLDEMISENLRTMVVVDEYGGISGLVTLKDLLREIGGTFNPIVDDGKGEKVIKIDESHYRVRGSLPITHWEDFFGDPIRDNINSTIGGFVISKLRRMPVIGDVVQFSNLEMKVAEMDQNRIIWVEVTIK